MHQESTHRSGDWHPQYYHGKIPRIPTVYLNWNSCQSPISSFLGSMLKHRHARRESSPRWLENSARSEIQWETSRISTKIVTMHKEFTYMCCCWTFPETSSNDIFWGKSKWMIPSTKWLVAGFWPTLLPSFCWWREDRSVQTLMDELDLPPDRANLFEAYDISCRATQMIDCVQTYWCQFAYISKSILFSYYCIILFAFIFFLSWLFLSENLLFIAKPGPHVDQLTGDWCWWLWNDGCHWVSSGQW